ncbi:putative Rab-GTPase-TBC domain containing protein [Trypanosoma cruzi]|nr:putative Rab-GTPase-TBC domain containing protein [Trypanosoma cruzi]
MEELRNIHHSAQEGRLEEALLRRVLDFARHRPFHAFHSLRWRLLLGLLPVNVEAGRHFQEWEECTRAGIRDWNEMNDNLQQRLVATDSAVRPVEKKGLVSKDEFSSFSSSSSCADDGESRTVENPLLPGVGSSYALRYCVDTIRATAQKDLDRLHWDFPLFEKSTTRKALMDLIVNYCLRHDYEYKQGMHEIAAFIFYLNHTDSALLEEISKSPEEADKALIDGFGRICPINGVMAMTFSLFENVMGASGLRLYEWYHSSEEYARDGIATASHRTQRELLAEFDPVLHHQMNVVYEIEGTSYLIRWLRLLYLREFSIPQCADLWDVFLSERFLARHDDYSLNNSIVTMLAASMLFYVKQDLMVGCIDALKRLMKYPPVEDVGTLVEMTIMQHDPKKNGIGRYFTPPERHELFGAKTPPPMEETSALATSSALLSPIEVMNQQGTILASIIARLELLWMPSSDAMLNDAGHAAETHARTIEELKKVRDVLLFSNGSKTQYA